MKNFPMMDFTSIITDYKATKEKDPDKVVEFVKVQANLMEAIRAEARSTDKDGKIHGHQRRNGYKKLEEYAEVLILKTESISQAKNFDEIYKIVESGKMKKIGDLARYDIALRIGFYLEKLPDKVYIHAGAKEGAKKLFGGKLKGRFIDRSKLIEPLKSADIECWQIEEILCRYKDYFPTK